MRCTLIRTDGTLVGEGPCGVRRDGAIEMVAERPTRPVRKGDGPLLLVEGPRRYNVRVADVHGLRDGDPTGDFEVYHLAPAGDHLGR